MITPLIAASQNGHDKVVSLLICKGAVVNYACKVRLSISLVHMDLVHEKCFICSHKCIILFIQNGLTALYIACSHGHIEVVQVLLNSGADVHKPCEVSYII